MPSSRALGIAFRTLVTTWLWPLSATRAHNKGNGSAHRSRCVVRNTTDGDITTGPCLYFRPSSACSLTVGSDAPRTHAAPWADATSPVSLGVSDREGDSVGPGGTGVGGMLGGVAVLAAACVAPGHGF